MQFLLFSQWLESSSIIFSDMLLRYCIFFPLVFKPLARLNPFANFSLPHLKDANEVHCPLQALPPQFLHPRRLHVASQRNPKIGWNNRIFFFSPSAPLLAILLMKSVPIAEVAKKFQGCIIAKTLDQRKELFKNLSLLINIQAATRGEQKVGVVGYPNPYKEELCPV